MRIISLKSSLIISFIVTTGLSIFPINGCHVCNQSHHKTPVNLTSLDGYKTLEEMKKYQKSGQEEIEPNTRRKRNHLVTISSIFYNKQEGRPRILSLSGCSINYSENSDLKQKAVEGPTEYPVTVERTHACACDTCNPPRGKSCCYLGFCWRMLFGQ